MKKTIYTTPEIKVMEYALSSVIAMSWSDEETGEALTNQRYDDEGDGWESYWEYRKRNPGNLKENR